MLDFAKLKTPATHGQVLVMPDPGAWLKVARENGASLRRADVGILGSTLSMWRRKAREAIVGRDDALLFVLGHQPEFIHPGVWAKHIVAMRAASAAGGLAVNLVVDSGAPRRTLLEIPSSRDHDLTLRPVPFVRLPRGYAYEQIAARSRDEVARFELRVCEAMGDRYNGSQMPLFFRSLLGVTDARDWVDQAVAARRAVEASFGVSVEDRRVSDVWCGPLLIDVLAHADRFAASYNNALAWYRREFGVHGAQRPIPDLRVSDDRCEAPVWAYRDDEPRRRLFVARTDDLLRLFAGDTDIGTVPLRHLDSCEALDSMLDDRGAWRLRPRALTLTLWARLLLADLFIHGIGGAKYDRISDAIIADYYHLTPPAMACVSATLHMDLPHSGATAESVQRLRRRLRDLEYNPQRNVPSGQDIDSLIGRRQQAVRRSMELRDKDRRNRRARREVFDEIRRINGAILAARQDMVTARRREFARTTGDLQKDRIALGREYFFGLFDRPRLELLLDALPVERDFRV